ncbi:MAG: hypothetical protein QOH21_1027 [Acidobacteriota bacterium]|jgi:hypothetical protein|nr:hypothetical protein [Acidobacteriota bacterium]
MLTAADVRHAEPFSLLRALGYPVAPVAVDREEWRRGGVALPWNGETRFHLAVRLRDFDLFVLEGRVGEDSIGEFLRSYRKYNIATKSVLINHAENRLALYDLGGKVLRRLDVDLAAPTAHAVDRLNLLAAGDESTLPRIFDRALDRESVGRQFFLRFRTAVNEVAVALRDCCDGETEEAIDAEALLILSRLLFLSFVQEKGWLNGERRFLVDRLAHEVERGREWFSGVLLPLFFGCLNTPLHERTLAARRLGRIPYLNGGLFEPTLLEQRHHELHLPNDLMQRVLEEVFEKFDFRLDELHGEGDPAGTHVDPEMLGKVFESLMAEGERAASGSFYTPKEIVDLLTEKAIVHWLGEGDAEQLLARLEGITILDPACGSGAFLLSALRVVERLHRQLAGTVPPDLRRRIVERSLFGVDVKPEAVRLCELRLWLAIVAQTDVAIEDVPPLPNLDRNIMQGNSLLAPTDFLGNARADIYRDWLYALRAQQDLLERYRTASHAHRPVLARIIRGNDQRLASDMLAKAIDAAEQELAELSVPRRDLFGRSTAAADAEECRVLQGRIAILQRKLQQVEEGTLDFFSFDIHFATVLAAGGFDVVAGNPPWVRNSRIEADTKEMLSDRYVMFRAQKGDGAFHQPDLSVTFFERAVQLAAPGGVVALLMPSKILNAGYAAPLRRLAAERMTLVALDDWSDDPRRRTWFDADTFPLGAVVCCGGKPAASHQIAVSAAGESFTLPQASLREVDEWSLVPPDVACILTRLRRTHRPLASVLGRRPFMGVKTGDNRSFFLDATELRADGLVLANGIKVPLDAVCRCVRGRDVKRWTTDASHWMLWPPVRGWTPAPRWLERLAAARQMKPEAFRLSFVRPEHVGIKVVWKDLSRGMAATVLPDEVDIDGRVFPLVPNQTLYALDAASLDEAYVLSAILNSTVADALLVSVAERAKDLHYRYFGRTVARMPFVRGEEETLLRLARRAHQGAAVQQELDVVVAKLYGVDARELEVLRSFVTRRLGAR